MKRHRFIVTEPLSGPEITLSDRGLVHQWQDVLHLNIGEEVILSDGQGKEAVASIVAFSGDAVTVTVMKQQKNTSDTTRKVTLYVAIIKRDNFEWVVQKATEVGAYEIIPIITERTIKLGLQPHRLDRIVKEAAEQSGRPTVPKVTQPLSFKDAVAHAVREHDATLFIDFSADTLLETAFNGKHVGVFVGPEGGFTPDERALAEKNNFTIRSLGPFTLRTETAAIVAGYVAGFMPAE